MEDELRLALRNWEATGDPRHAIEFTNLFLRSGSKIPKVKASQNIYVLRYEHRHGEDVSTYRTRKAALAAAANIILEQMEDEIDDEEIISEIETSIEQGNIEEAVQTYCEIVEESIGIEECKLS